MFKGNYRITAEKDCTVLAHKHEVVVMKKHPDGREELVTLGQEVHDERVNDTGHRIRWPYDMKPGDQIEHWMIVMDIDIPAALQHYEAKRAGARRTLEIPGASHAALVSHPAAVAKLIVEAGSLARAAA